MSHAANYDDEDQLDIFSFMDESEQDKQLYEEDPLDTVDAVHPANLINALCKTCENCQYKAISKHTKVMSCIMFDCDMHRAFTECRGYKTVNEKIANKFALEER